MAADDDGVMFDILLRSAGSGRLPDVHNVGEFYADAADIESCRKWFAERGIDVHATAFGLSGSAPREVFEDVFAARLERGDSGYIVLVEPVVPAELEALIDQVTVAASPALF